MSNIFKWNYINFDGREKHIVDSDQSDRVKEAIIGDITQGLLGNFHIETPQDMVDGILNPKDTEDETAEFTEGMNVINYDKMMGDERERIVKEADSLLSDAKEKAQALMDDALSEIEGIKARAFEEGKFEGFQEGLNDGKESLEQKKQELQAEIDAVEEDKIRLEEEYEQYQAELEPFFAELTISIIDKLTGILLEDKRDILLYLIEKGFEDAGQNQYFVIHVSEEDYPFVKEEKEHLLSAVSEETQLEIIEDAALLKGQCIIETDKKMIDVSLDVQLRNLYEDLRMLSVST